MPTPPGDGKVSPFGNHQGATAETGAAGTGGNDFTTNIAGNGRTVAVDHSKLFASRPQKTGTGVSGANPDSIPAGGRLPLIDSASKDATKPLGKNRKPFKVSGGAATGAEEPTGGEGGVGGLPE